MNVKRDFEMTLRHDNQYSVEKVRKEKGRKPFDKELIFFMLYIYLSLKIKSVFFLRKDFIWIKIFCIFKCFVNEAIFSLIF